MADGAGWTRVTSEFENVGNMARWLLRFGTVAEIAEPDAPPSRRRPPPSWINPRPLRCSAFPPRPMLQLPDVETEPLSPLPGVGVAEDLDHERAARPVGLAGRVGLAAILALAVAGVFGGRGPLVRTEARAASAGGALVVRYDRFARLDAPTVLVVALPRADSAVVLSAALARDLRLDTVQPSPASESSTDDGGLRLVGSPGETFRLHARPMRFGRIVGRIAVPGGPGAAVRMLVSP